MAFGPHRLMSLVLAAGLLLCLANQSLAAPRDKTKKKQPAVAPEPLCWGAGEQLLNSGTRHNKTSPLPPELASNSTRPSVTLKLCIDSAGDVAKTFVLRSSGSTAVDSFYKEAVAKWTFKPAQKDGKAVPSFMHLWVGWNTP